ncbi:MAG: hypothetical protein PW843_21825 [Azospirillaceae bacterium]|nr:hypothetical protein [Azospirillaceae bacterium]
MTDQTLSGPNTSSDSPLETDGQPDDIRIPDIYAYAMVIVPPIGALIEHALHQLHGTPPHDVKLVGSFATGIAYLVLAGLDRGAIRPALNRLGRNFSFLWVLLTPAYLWRRTSCLNQPRKVFWVWWLGLAAGVLVEVGLRGG